MTAALEHRFTYHAPADPQREEAHRKIREACLDLAEKIYRLAPLESRERALAMTNLEQVMFWANAGIARQL